MNPKIEGLKKCPKCGNKKMYSVSGEHTFAKLVNTKRMRFICWSALCPQEFWYHLHTRKITARRS